MTEYRFHWLPAGGTRSITLQAESHLHGAAIALRQFIELGCDLTTPFAHLDIVESKDVTRTLLVEEVLDWLHAPQQGEFVRREGLSLLLH